ncbi:hypothetical protein A3C57_01530 [Candidatus Nomurabacteria bacterium RIFCSPHIGHO2_02_FULL_33_12]|uniref:CARDB domain-containing protein n=1 Tax=Candidatus Nomurabacteria bacterium RIFCSPLOWO2_01_FULL_33_17 TaxID=1801764 RepID=A0A1F6WQJ0_9BACT|nr:MAG: hypothetical protein A3C57_01530 [Candidatus Nomurabacteria bacterium RIFCSPHIGHO2_02_FULL_33_12]OGI84158.1 MAG: hypothetical protein A2903_01155 [Candidatus Nomurabacteria bacterium RIFCSPLOWO2_01_FULL_33_17]
MSWRSRRQLSYLGIFGLVILIILFIIIYPIIFRAPTCTDLKQNGIETGVDCGGQCQLYCPKTVALPKVDWANIFFISEDVYNVVAMLTSTAPTAGSRNASYTFTIYDEAGAIIKEVKGNTFIPSASEFAVFEPQIRTGERIPARVRFTWDENIIYFEKTKVNSNSLPIDVSLWQRETVLETERLTVKISNNGLSPVPESDYIVIVYDENDEPIAASKTRTALDARSQATLFFSWPYQFRKDPKRYELIKRINPFSYAK